MSVPLMIADDMALRGREPSENGLCQVPRGALRALAQQEWRTQPREALPALCARKEVCKAGRRERAAVRRARRDRGAGPECKQRAAQVVGADVWRRERGAERDGTRASEGDSESG